MAGVGAWTAPVILDSLSSPAAALSGTGTFCLAIDQTSCLVQQTSDYATVFVPTDCTQNDCTSGTPVAMHTPLSEFCITANNCTWETGPGKFVSFSIGAGCPTCTFTSGVGAVIKTGSDCVAGVLSNANKTITFTFAADTTTWTGFRLFVTCT